MTTEKIESTFSAPVAEIWDAFYGAESTKEVEFYLKQFDKSSPLRGRTLEVGCGTGRFLLPLLKQGHEVIGIDASDDMLAVLRKKAREAGFTPDARRIDFADFQDPGGFDGVVAFYVVFYMLRTEELRNFFEKSFELLNSGGVFVFNYYNIYEMWKPKKWESKHTNIFPEGFARIEYTYNPIDHLRGIADMMDYRILSTYGTHHMDCTSRKVRFYTMTEFSLLLEDAGFQDIKTFSDLNEPPLGDEDVKGYTLYMTARKL